MPIKLVLIVDDHVEVRKGLKLLFESEQEFSVCGYAVDGRDAIEKATELKPDLIVLDFSMPVMNGIEASRILSQMFPATVLLLFTIHKNLLNDKDLKGAGIHAVVSKSDGVGTLISQARGLLGLPSF